MPAQHVIRDIRFFESEKLGHLGHYTGELFRTTPATGANALRIADKLRQFRFVTGDFHHVYICLNSALRPGEIRVEPVSFEWWCKQVDFGADPVAFRRLDQKGQEQFVIDSTFAVLLVLCGRDREKRELVVRVRRELAAQGDDLEITRTEKETASYKVVITYKVAAHPNKHLAFIEYIDKKSGVRAKKPFLAMTSPEDILFLVDKVAVSRGAIRISPRRSFRAKLYAKDYRVPIVLRVSDLLDDSKVIIKKPKNKSVKTSENLPRVVS